MTLDSIMTRHVVTVRMDDSIRAVRNLFDRYQFHHVVVLEHCRVVGVISDRDLLKNTSPFVGTKAERALDAASLNKRVHQIMTREVVTATPETSAGDAALTMLNRRLSCLPVVNPDGACVGIVTMRDLLRWSLGRLTDGACETHLRADAERRAA